MERIKKIILKKIILFFILNLTLTGSCISQNCEDLQQQSSNLIKEGKFEEAIKIAELGVTKCKKEFGSNSLNYGISVYILAILNEKNNKLNEAEVNYLEAKTIFKKTVGENNPTYINILNRLGDLYKNSGNYSKAEPLLLEVVDTRKIISGEESKDYTNSLNNLALLYMAMGEFSKAESLLLKTKEIQKKSIGENDPNFAITLLNLAELYRNTGNYSQAEKFLIETIRIQNKVLKQNDPDYAISLNNLAALYRDWGKYDKAEPLYLQSISIQKKALGDEHPDFLNTLSNLAALYKDLDRFSESESLYLKAVSIQKKILGDEHPDYLNTLSNLAQLYLKTGQFDNSKAINNEVLSIRRKVLGESNPDYALSLSNVAQLYSIMGDYSKAETLFEQALSIQKKVLGDEHPNTITTLSNLATLYVKMKIFKKAESSYLQVFKIQNKILGNEHIDCAITLNNLAELYRAMGLYDKSENLYMQALSIQKKVLGENNLQYALYLNNIGRLYCDNRNFKQAETFYLQALTIQNKVLGDQNSDYAITLNNLAVLYDYLGDFSKSESYYLQAIKAQRKMFGEKHPDYVTSLSNLATFYDDNGIFSKAEILYNQTLSIKKSIWQTDFSFLNSSEMDQFISNNLSDQESVLSFLIRNNNSSCVSQAANFNLFIKNILQNNSQLLEKIAANNNNNNVPELFKQYKGIRLYISHLLQLPIEKQENLTELQSKSDSLEKELKRLLPEFQNLIINNALTWNNVQKKLNSNDATIDFVNFQYFNKHWTDTIFYAAFVTRPNWQEPQFVKLFNENQLTLLFDSSSNSLSINNLYFAKDSSCNSKLYNLVWKPMDSLLTGVKRVYISPSGLLNRVSFSAIPMPGGGRLIDRYSVDVMSNIRTIAETKSNVSEKPLSISLIGGVNYDEEPTVSDSQQLDFNTSDTSFSNLRSLKGGKWSYLLGAENEVITINKVLTPLKISLGLKTGSNASEEFVKEIGSGTMPVPSVMHIATHGFSFASPKSEVINEKSFLQNDNKQVFRSSEDALTRAGLVMAGGNKFWTTGTTYQNHEDGILTAREISDLNLNGCILATLSACETGLGEIKGSEGVFGLQRAFKMAGVKYLIVSLWKVPDAQTTEFMQLFYSLWLIQKLPIREAFHQTQLTMSKKYLPYQWAAFVLVE